MRRHPVDIVFEEVTGLAKNGDGSFRVVCSEQDYAAKAVIIASGKKPRRLGVPGEEEFTGRGVGYCATCDGPLYAGKDVAVVGGGNSAVQAAIELGAIAAKVYLIVRSRYRADPVLVEKLADTANVEVLMGHVARAISGRNAVEKFIVAGRDTGRETALAVQGVFVEIGLDPNSRFAADITRLNESGEIAVDCRAATDIPGLFAAGDVASGPDKQIIIAAGEGAKAALGAYEYLLHRR